MSHEINNMLEDEIKTCISDINSFTLGSKEYDANIKTLEILHKLKINEEEALLTAEVKKNEHYIKNEQLLSDKERLCMERDAHETKTEVKKNKIIDVSLAVCKVVFETGLPLFVYCKLHDKGLKFEETGTYCSQTHKGLLSKLKVKFGK